MNIKKSLELVALAFGIAAMVTIIYYLITKSTTCFLPYEPILWIRIPEIIIGIICIIVLAMMIKNLLKK